VKALRFSFAWRTEYHLRGGEGREGEGREGRGTRGEGREGRGTRGEGEGREGQGMKKEEVNLWKDLRFPYFFLIIKSLCNFTPALLSFTCQLEMFKKTIIK
jgi:hypothetical protein